jgi:acyl-CoA hydrolase
VETKKYKSIKDSETTLTELMIPSYANFGGKIHGGFLLSLMDKVAYVTATKHSGAYCVTVAVEGVEFLSPVEVGDLVSIKASVNFVCNTTMIIGMRVEALNTIKNSLRHTNSCYFTMAAKDDNGQLMEVPGLFIENELQLRRYAEAKELKKISLEKRKMFKSDLNYKTIKELKLDTKYDKCKIEF